MAWKCSRQILLRDSSARIVILSSMKDDTLTTRARLLGIRWFLQKPATREELVRTIKNGSQPGRPVMVVRRSGTASTVV